MPAVTPTADVRAFFRGLVEEAMRSLEVRTADETQHYLVNLLARYAVSQQIRDVSTPFVDLLARALDAEGLERVARLQALGDAALVVSGFFADSCERRGVTHPYVVAIGARAYGEVGRASRWTVATERAGDRYVFEELADRFEACASVLDEVREQTALCTDGELVRVYERWCETRSPELYRRLHRRGMTPSGSPSGRGPVH
jgi:hypothetical protein